MMITDTSNPTLALSTNTYNLSFVFTRRLAAKRLATRR